MEGEGERGGWRSGMRARAHTGMFGPPRGVGESHCRTTRVGEGRLAWSLRGMHEEANTLIWTAEEAQVDEDRLTRSLKGVRQKANTLIWTIGEAPHAETPHRWMAIPLRITSGRL